jgi:DNA repair protein RadC
MMLTSNTNGPALYVREAGRRYRAATRDELAAAIGAADYRGAIGETLRSPIEARRFLSARLQSLHFEVFGLVLLDNRHRVRHIAELFRGTIDGASVHPREVVRLVLEHNAAAVTIFHNHPSGVAEPSQADELITARIKDALALIEVRTLDHLIVAPGGNCVSFAERGLL